MNILIDIRLLGHGGNSGIREYTRRLTEHLITSDSENRYLLLYAGFRKTPLPESWLTRPNVSLINWHVPNKLLDASARFFDVPKIDTATGADIVLSPNLNILRFARTSHVMTFHDLSFIHYPSFFSLKQRMWHKLQDWRREAERAAHLIADSEFTKSDLVALGFQTEKISVVYPGVHPSFRPLPKDDPERGVFRRRRKIASPFLLSLGTLEPRKNIPAAIRAFTILKQRHAWKDLSFVIAGSPGWLYHEIIREARASHASRDIIFLGPVADSERILLYNEARAFVYPSFFEGFGFPPLEAQSCGCPVVVSNRTSLPEIIGGSGITVDPWKVTDLVEGLASAMEDGQKRTALIEAGYVNAARFRWEKTASRMQHILKNFYRERTP